MRRVAQQICKATNCAQVACRMSRRGKDNVCETRRENTQTPRDAHICFRSEEKLCRQGPITQSLEAEVEERKKGKRCPLGAGSRPSHMESCRGLHASVRRARLSVSPPQARFSLQSSLGESDIGGLWQKHRTEVGGDEVRKESFGKRISVSRSGKLCECWRKHVKLLP